MNPTVRKDVCPFCNRKRILLRIRVFYYQRGWKCTKCGNWWSDSYEGYIDRNVAIHEKKQMEKLST